MLPSFYAEGNELTVPFDPGGRLSIKTVFPWLGSPIIKIRRSHDRLIFMIGIHTWKDHLYIKTGPSTLHENAINFMQPLRHNMEKDPHLQMHSWLASRYMGCIENRIVPSFQYLLKCISINLFVGIEKDNFQGFKWFIKCVVSF